MKIFKRKPKTPDRPIWAHKCPRCSEWTAGLYVNNFSDGRKEHRLMCVSNGCNYDGKL